MTIDEAWGIVATASRKHGKAFGGPTMGVDEMQKRHRQGAQLLVNSSELGGWSEELVDKKQQFDELD